MNISPRPDEALDEDAVILEMCRAHDREDAAQKGEPSPWKDDDGLDDAEWRSERFFAMREAFDVAKAAHQEGEMAAVKALEWQDVSDKWECTKEEAPALGGKYRIVVLDARGGDGRFSTCFDIGGLAFRFVLTIDDDGYSVPAKFATSVGAKAAAHADYERRIRSALVPARSPQDAEVAEQVEQFARSQSLEIQRLRAAALVTEEMVEAAMSAYWAGNDKGRESKHGMRLALEVALSAAAGACDLAHAPGYATRLLISLMEKHYPDRHPEWKPLPDLMGVLTQIDNMSTGLVRAALSSAAGVAEEWRPIELHIVFKDDGGPANLRFVEVETIDGKSVRAGTWMQRDGYHVLALWVHPSEVTLPAAPKPEGNR